jgi:hypothetical protein
MNTYRRQKNGIESPRPIPSEFQRSLIQIVMTGLISGNIVTYPENVFPFFEQPPDLTYRQPKMMRTILFLCSSFGTYFEGVISCSEAEH